MQGLLWMIWLTGRDRQELYALFATADEHQFAIDRDLYLMLTC